MSKQPNILWIISDQHNAKVLGHEGHPDVKTPHLDRLAGQGVRFSRAITQNPICTPSRMCFFSGQYAHNHGYYGLEGPNPNGLPTVMGRFRQAGYTTAVVGKIHCPEYWIEDDVDFFREVCGCSIGGCPEYLEHIHQQGLTNELKQSHEVRTWFDGFPSPMPYRDCWDGWTAQQAMDFIEQACEGDKPFFVQMSLPSPHEVYCPSREFWDLYNESSLSLPPNSGYDMRLKAPNLRREAEYARTGEWTRFEPHTFEAGRLRKLHGYLGLVSQVDHAAGELLDLLDRKGISDDTIVIYSSDHGDYAFEHDIPEKAPGISSDAITRVPFIWRWGDRFPAGHVCDEIVEMVDLPNTLCTLAGLEQMETADGKDISHLLNGRQGAVHEIGVTEFAWSKSVRKGKYRLVYYPKTMFEKDWPDGFGELYDVETDPWEMKNLYFDEAYAGVVAELHADLLDWLVTTSRPTSVLLVNNVQHIVSKDATTRHGVSTNADDKIHPKYIKQACEMKRWNYL